MEVALRREQFAITWINIFFGVKWHELPNVAELEYLKHFEGSWTFVKDPEKVSEDFERF
jgi:hypothetical protein